jgi:hypothetical protein
MTIQKLDSKGIPIFNINDKVAINKGKSTEDKRKRSSDIFRGRVVAVTDRLVTVKSKNGYKESFSFVDFLTGVVRLV